MTKILFKSELFKKLFLSFLIYFLFLGMNAFAQSDWKVSDAKANMQNPVQADDASIKEGKVLYMTNCKSCHGDPGKNNVLPLVPKPSDMANAAFLSANSDGAIFDKITEGRVVMPTFKAVLSDVQRWQIVNYIRSFDENKKVTKTIAVIKNDGQELSAPYQLNLEYLAEENTLSALVLGTASNSQQVPAKDIEVSFFIKRYFGNLPFGDIGGLSDAKGLITADIPIDLPGGEEGKAIAFAKLSDTDTYGDIFSEVEVNVRPVEIVNLLNDRSLWTVRVMAPWWLIFTYFGILIGVWLTLGYVVLQLFKLKKAGV